MKLENLIKVKSYADMKGVTVPWIWRLIKGGKLECIYIDGMCFIVLSDEGLEDYKKFRETLNELLSK